MCLWQWFFFIYNTKYLREILLFLIYSRFSAALGSKDVMILQISDMIEMVKKKLNMSNEGHFNSLSFGKWINCNKIRKKDFHTMLARWRG